MAQNPNTSDWTAITAGSIPTAPPSIDTYGLMQQVAEIAGGYRPADPRTPVDWTTQEDATTALRGFVVNIVGLGALYFRPAAYPPIPAWVFLLCGCAGDNTDVSASEVDALVRSYQQRSIAAGVPVVYRPEQVDGAH